MNLEMSSETWFKYPCKPKCCIVSHLCFRVERNVKMSCKNTASNFIFFCRVLPVIFQPMCSFYLLLLPVLYRVNLYVALQVTTSYGLNLTYRTADEETPWDVLRSQMAFRYINVSCPQSEK